MKNCLIWLFACNIRFYESLGSFMSLNFSPTLSPKDMTATPWPSPLGEFLRVEWVNLFEFQPGWQGCNRNEKNATRVQPFFEVEKYRLRGLNKHKRNTLTNGFAMAKKRRKWACNCYGKNQRKLQLLPNLFIFLCSNWNWASISL